MFVANADFDLQYNGGTVQALDVERIRSMVERLLEQGRADSGSCAAAGLPPNPNPVNYPGPCGPIDLDSPPDGRGTLVQASRQLGAFTTDILVVCRPEGGTGAWCEPDSPATQARLFASVRGDPSLTYFDIDDDRAGGAQGFMLDCGQSNTGGRCDPSHRLGSNSSENNRGLTLPPEPFDIAVSEGAEAILVTHQISPASGGAVSLFASAGPDLFSSRPVLQHVLTNLAPYPVGVAAVPIPAVTRLASTAPAALATEGYRPGFVVGYRNAARLDLVRYYSDSASAPARPFFGMARTTSIPLGVSAGGFDSRGIAIDREPRSACETQCGDDYGCLLGCASVRLPVYVANRSPAALLLGETITTVTPESAPSFPGASLFDEYISMYDAIPLAAGPSRVVLGGVFDRDGVEQKRVFVICFDARAIIVYDPERRQVEAQIRTGRGPQALVLDRAHRLAYVVHFTDSYIGVLDLDEAHPATFETMVASIGTPRPPEAVK